MREDLPGGMSELEDIIGDGGGGGGCREEKGEWRNVPTDLLPTMAILRCFCCGGMMDERLLDCW